MSCIRVLCIFSVGFCILSCGKNNLEETAKVAVEPLKTVQEAFTEFVSAFQAPYEQGCIFTQNPSTIKGGTEKTVNGKKVLTVNGESGSFTITLLAGDSWNADYRQVEYNYQNYTSRGFILNNINNRDLFGIIVTANSNEFEIKLGAGIAISGIFTATLKSHPTDTRIDIKDCKTLDYDNPLIFTYKRKDGNQVLKLKKTENLELFKMFYNKAEM